MRGNPRFTFTYKRGRLVMLLVVAIMMARIIATYSEFSQTADEGVHITAGLEWYQFHRYTADLQHPPGARLALALLPYLSGARLSGKENATREWRSIAIHESRRGHLVRLGRAGNLIFVPILLYFTWRWAVELYGTVAGVAAVVILSCSPSILAHAGLATVDLALAAALIALSHAAYHWWQGPTFKRSVAVAAWGALAVSVKYSAVVFAPAIFVLIGALYSLRRVRSTIPGTNATPKNIVLHSSLIVVGVITVVWAEFFFDIGTLRDPALPVPTRMATYFPPDAGWTQPIYGFTGNIPLPLANFVKGLAMASLHALRGHTLYHQGHVNQFLLGEMKSNGGWWYYFPVALAVKTTLPFLILIVVAGVFLVSHRKAINWPGTACIAGCIALLLVVAMTSSLNIGIRHILPIYPFAAVFASSVLARPSGTDWRHRLVPILGVLLVATHVAESARAHPDYLPYFNEIARGREQKFLLDSNLDWGQDLVRLGKYVEQNNIRHVSFAWWGEAWLAHLWVPGVYLFPPAERPSGWVAASVNEIEGLVNHGDANYRWLRRYIPVKHIGKSIWLYYIVPDGGIPPP